MNQLLIIKENGNVMQIQVLGNLSSKRQSSCLSH